MGEVKSIFDPEGEGYDEETALELFKSYPLTVPKPTTYQGDYVGNEDAMQTWVWHPELKDYVKHSASLDPRTGMVLKGRKHPTWNLTEETETKMGNQIIQKDGRYYSQPKEDLNSIWDQADEIDPAAAWEEAEGENVGPDVKKAAMSVWDYLNKVNEFQLGKDILTDFAGATAKGSEEVFGPLARGEFDVPTAVVQTVLGLGTGVVGFADEMLARFLNVAKQVKTGAVEELTKMHFANMSKEQREKMNIFFENMKGMDIDWDEAFQAGEMRKKLYEFEPTDPLARASLMFLASIPMGVENAFNVLSDQFKDPNLKAFTQTVGWLMSLAAFGEVFKGIKTGATGAKPIPPEKLSPSGKAFSFAYQGGPMETEPVKPEITRSWMPGENVDRIPTVRSGPPIPERPEEMLKAPRPEYPPGPPPGGGGPPEAGGPTVDLRTKGPSAAEVAKEDAEAEYQQRLAKTKEEIPPAPPHWRPPNMRDYVETAEEEKPFLPKGKAATEAPKTSGMTYKDFLAAAQERGVVPEGAVGRLLKTIKDPEAPLPKETTLDDVVDWLEGRARSDFGRGKTKAPKVEAKESAKDLERAFIKNMKPQAVFLGWQESLKGHVPLYNIVGGESHGSTVGAPALKKLGIRVPKPSSPAPAVESKGIARFKPAVERAKARIAKGEKSKLASVLADLEKKEAPDKVLSPKAAAAKRAYYETLDYVDKLESKGEKILDWEETRGEGDTLWEILSDEEGSVKPEVFIEGVKKLYGEAEKAGKEVRDYMVQVKRIHPKMADKMMEQYENYLEEYGDGTLEHPTNVDRIGWDSVFPGGIEKVYKGSTGKTVFVSNKGRSRMFEPDESPKFASSVANYILTEPTKHAREVVTWAKRQLGEHLTAVPKKGTDIRAEWEMKQMVERGADGLTNEQKDIIGSLDMEGMDAPFDAADLPAIRRSIETSEMWLKSKVLKSLDMLSKSTKDKIESLEDRSDVFTWIMDDIMDLGWSKEVVKKVGDSLRKILAGEEGAVDLKVAEETAKRLVEQAKKASVNLKDYVIQQGLKPDDAQKFVEAYGPKGPTRREFLKTAGKAALATQLPVDLIKPLGKIAEKAVMASPKTIGLKEIKSMIDFADRYERELEKVRLETRKLIEQGVEEDYEIMGNKARDFANMWDEKDQAAINKLTDVTDPDGDISIIWDSDEGSYLTAFYDKYRDRLKALTPKQWKLMRDWFSDEDLYDELEGSKVLTRLDMMGEYPGIKFLVNAHESLSRAEKGIIPRPPKYVRELSKPYPSQYSGTGNYLPTDPRFYPLDAKGVSAGQKAVAEKFSIKEANDIASLLHDWASISKYWEESGPWDYITNYEFLRVNKEAIKLFQKTYEKEVGPVRTYELIGKYKTEDEADAVLDEIYDNEKNVQAFRNATLTPYKVWKREHPGYEMNKEFVAERSKFIDSLKHGREWDAKTVDHPPVEPKATWGKDLIKAAIKYFGTATKLRHAGYILEDGTALSMADAQGTRIKAHHDAVDLLPEGTPFEDSVETFLDKARAVRVGGGFGEREANIELVRPMSKKQLEVVEDWKKDYFKEPEKAKVIVDYNSPTGLKSFELEPGEPLSKINDLIKKLDDEQGFIDLGTAKDAASKIAGKTSDYLKKVRAGKIEAIRKDVEKLKAENLTATDNALDKAATEYLKTGKLEDYVNNMPELGEVKPRELFKEQPEAREGIAATGEKKIAAVKPSGFFVSKKFSDAFEGKDVNDISKRDVQWADPARFIEAIDQGHHGGPAQQNILWPARRNTLAKLRWSDEMKTKFASILDNYDIRSKQRSEAMGDVLEKVNSATDKPSDLLANKDIQKILFSIKRKYHEGIVKAAIETRGLFDELLAAQNLARGKRGQKAIEYRQNYKPWVKEASALWDRLGEVLKSNEVIESPELPDFVRPEAPFNARALERSKEKGDRKLERKIITLVSNYIDTAAKDIFDTNTVQNNKIHSLILRRKGLENAAEAVDTWTAEVFAGVNPRLTRWAKETLPPWMRSSLLQIRRNLTRAVFPLNWTWNLFIQTSSAGLTPVRYGGINSLKGLAAFTDPVLKKAIWENAYSHIIKSRRGGHMSYQDVTDTLGKFRNLDASKIDKAEDYMNFLTNVLEEALTRHAVAAAYFRGKQMGMEGRSLWEFAGEGGAKTQSMYNYQDIPGILRSKEVGAIAPFQTFSIEVFNTIRELDVPVLRRLTGKTGIYETFNANSAAGHALLKSRLAKLAKWAIAIQITNSIVDEAIGRKPWEPSSFIPFFALMTGGPYVGKGPIHQQYIQGFKDGVKDLMKHGGFKTLRRWFIQYHVPAGIQIERTLEGIEAVVHEEARDVRGQKLFPVKTDMDKVLAIAGGPYRTSAGKEYLRKKQEATEFEAGLTLRSQKRKGATIK